MLLQSESLHFPQFYANLSLYKWLAACLTAKNSNHHSMPRGHKCVMRTDLQQKHKICAWAHRELYMQVFSCIFWCICIHLPFLSVPNQAMQRVWGWGFWRKSEGGEGGGRRRLGENTVCPQRESRFEFQIHCKESFSWVIVVVIFLKPHHTTKVRRLDSSSTLLKFLTVRLFTHYLSASQTESGIMGTVVSMAFQRCRWMKLCERG